MKNPGDRLNEKLLLFSDLTERQDIEDGIATLPYSDIRWLKVCGVVTLSDKGDGEYMDLTDDGMSHIHSLKE